MKTQKERVLAHLLTGKTLTPLLALRLYGSLRLGAIIWELRKSYYISTTLIRVGKHKRVAQYELKWVK